MIDILFARPQITINDIASALGVSHQSATRYVNTLEEEDILSEITDQVRNRIYQTDAVLEAIAPPLPGHEEDAV